MRLKDKPQSDAALRTEAVTLIEANEAQSARSGEVIPRPRIQTLSDLIFGLALSIGAISLLGGRPSNLSDLAGSLVGFGWAFVILALVWVRYTRLMSVLPIETNAMVGMNLLLLFLVSIEPYLYNLITNSFVLPGASLDSGITTSLYAADMGGIFLVLSYFLFDLTKEKRNILPKRLIRGYRLMVYGSIAAAGLFLVSILPVFWSLDVLGIQMRFILWMGTFVVMLVRRSFEERTKGANQGLHVSESRGSSSEKIRSLLLGIPRQPRRT